MEGLKSRPQEIYPKLAQFFCKFTSRYRFVIFDVANVVGNLSMGLPINGYCPNFEEISEVSSKMQQLLAWFLFLVTFIAN